jgi:hypothetical protein
VWIKLALISTLGFLAGKVVPTGAFADRQITGRFPESSYTGKPYFLFDEYTG